MTVNRQTGPVLEESERRELLIDEIAALVDEEDLTAARLRLAELHPADQAEILEEISEPARDALLSELTEEDLADVVEHLDEEPRSEWLAHLDADLLSRLLVLVDDDLAADLVEELPDDRVQEVLALLEDPEGVTELLSLPEDSAGRWMSPDVISLKRNWSVDEAFTHLRKMALDADQPFYLYVVDEEDVLVGVVLLRRLITAPPETPVEQIMTGDVISVRVDMDQEAAAERLRHYDLMALPVVDPQGRLVGVLTADDVLDVQVEEATEDILLQAGLDAESSALNPIGVSLRQRVPWLLVNLVIGFFSALIVSFFEETIARVAVLAAFMPIIAGHGGNTGCQTTTLVVRGIALGEIYRRSIPKLVAREVSFGLIYGALAGALTGILAFVLTRDIRLSGVVFAAMVGNIIVAGFAGAVIPLGLRALNIDPALASTVWLTTFTDWVGFFLLLGLGTYMVL